MIKKLLHLFRARSAEGEAPPPPDLSRIFPELAAADAPREESGGEAPPTPSGEPTREDMSPTGKTMPWAPDSADFADWLAGDIEQLRDNLHTLSKLPTSPSRIRALFLTSHNLRGTAEPYGYPVIGRICTSLCMLLDGTEDAAPDLALVNLHVEAAAAAARAGPGEASDELADTVCRALEEKVARRTGSN